MVPIMAFLHEKVLLLTQPSQDLPLLVRAQRMPGPYPTAGPQKGHPAACGAQGSVAHVTLQPVCEGGSASPFSPGPRDRWGRTTRGGIRSPGLAVREKWGPYNCLMLILWFVSPIQERNEALDDFACPEPENQVCVVYIQTCW